MSNWLSLLCGVLFVYRGIQDLRNGGGTGWSSEDEKKHFSKFSGIALLLCGAVYLVNVFLPRVEPLHTILMVTALLVCIGFLISNLCYHGTRNDGKSEVPPWTRFFSFCCCLFASGSGCSRFSAGRSHLFADPLEVRPG